MPEGRIALAVSDSPLSRALEAELPVSHLETSGPLIASAARECQKPLLVHNSVWNWSLADMGALPEVLKATRSALTATRAPWLSVHFGFSATRVSFKGGMQPASATLSREEVGSSFSSAVLTLRDALGVPLLLENLDYAETGTYEHICEPEVIRGVLEGTDTFFLLDLAHAQVSAARLGYELQAYLERLPLERVRQLHLSGPRVRNGVLQDAHEPLRPEDYALLEYVLARTRPWVVTLEYNRDADALREQLSELGHVLGETVD